MIILSTHLDTVKPLELNYDKGVLWGLLDDFAGTLCLFSALVQEKELVHLEKQGKIKLYFNNAEEFGRLDNPPAVKKEDTVICIDIADSDKLSMENISGFKSKDLKDLRESLEWESFKFSTKEYTGDPEDMDDGWLWKGKCRVISLILPAKGDWHSNSVMKIEDLKDSVRFLTRLICYLL